MAAPMFTVDTHRHDPYRAFKFQVVIDGVTVAGLTKMTALKKETELVKWRSVGDPSHERDMPGSILYRIFTVTRRTRFIIQLLQDLYRKQEARIMIEVIGRKLLIRQGEMHRKDTSLLGIISESDVKRTRDFSVDSAVG